MNQKTILTVVAPQDTKGLYLRGKIWWFRWPMKGGVQRKPVTLETEDLGQAIARKRQLLILPDLAPAGSVTAEIELHLLDMQARGKYTLASVATKKYSLRDFAKWLPRGMRVDAVLTAQLREYYREMLGRMTPGAAWTRWMDVRAFYTWSVSQNKVRTNLVRDAEAQSQDSISPIVRPPRPVRVRYCELALMDQLIANCKREDLKFILMCGFHAGMRINEIEHAVPEWFDMKHNIVDLHDTDTKKFNKTKRARKLSMRLELRAYLEEYGMRRPFMLRPDVKPGKGVYRWYFEKPLQTYLRTQMWEGQNCLWVSPHVLRHTFASLLARQGMSCWEIAQAMGNSEEEVRRVYAHLNPRYHSIELDRTKQAAA